MRCASAPKGKPGEILSRIVLGGRSKVNDGNEPAEVTFGTSPWGYPNPLLKLPISFRTKADHLEADYLAETYP